MALITFLGGSETGDVAFVDWGQYRFHINQPTECDDAHIVAKASRNQFFLVGLEDEPPADPLDHDRDGRKGGSLKAPPSDDLAILREDYEELMGKKPFMGWDAEKLREKIAEAERAKDEGDA